MVTGKEILCESCRFSFGTELYNIDRCVDCIVDDRKHHYQRDVNKEPVYEYIELELEKPEVPVTVQKKGRKSKK